MSDCPDFILLSQPSACCEIHCNAAVIIARIPDDLPQKLFCPHAVAVIDSDNSALRREVSSRRLPALTCGRSDTDTFTLTSFTGDSAVISLGRQICSFDQNIVEPFELPVSLSQSADAFDVMAAAAVFCLLGKAGLLASQEKWSPESPFFYKTKNSAFLHRNLQS